VAFYIKQEDVHTHDPELSEWIDNNTCRFRNLFYEVTDSFIQAILGDNEVSLFLLSGSATFCVWL
jgi:hypothetical protein